MSLRTKINLFSIFLYFTVSAVFILAGNRVIENAVYQQYQNFITNEIKHISKRLNTYSDAAMSHDSEELKSLIAEYSDDGCQLFIITSDGKAIIHQKDGGALISPEFIREMLDQNHGQSVYYFKGQRWLTAFQSLPEKNYLAAITVSFDFIFQKKSEYLFQLFIIVSFIFLVNILILNYLISNIVRRVNSLLDYSKKIAAGDLSYGTEKEGIPADEIGRLHKNILLMVEKVKEKLQNQSVTESALKESEERLSLALDAANCGLWEFNPTANTNVHFGDRWFSMLGYSPSELPHSAETWIRLMHPDDKAETLQLLQNHMENQKVAFETEFRMKAKNGSYQWIRSVGKIISKDKQGLPDRMIGLHMDINEQKEAEETRKRMESHMRRSQKIEAVGTLADGISRGFSNSLSSVLEYTDIALNETGKESPAYIHLQKIIIAAEKAKSQISQIQAFNQQSEGRQTPLQIAQVVKEMLNMLKAAIPATIEIRSKFSSNSNIFGDPVQISQVLLNLFTNAERAMQGKPGILTVILTDVLVDTGFAHTLVDIKPGKYVKLSVGDTGCGMSQELQDRIFDPFFTTDKEREGAGLGLSIAHGIIRNHNGCMTVNSKTGEGSTFNIFLPVYEMENEDRQFATADIPGGSESILFVDDEIPVLETGTILMERLGYRVTTEKNSLNALEIFKNNPDQFDLVITDICMPQLDGDELACEMMRIRPDLPIILCTGFSARMNEERSREIGIRAFVNKPLLMWEIADTIRKVLDGKKINM